MRWNLSVPSVLPLVPFELLSNISGHSFSVYSALSGLNGHTLPSTNALPPPASERRFVESAPLSIPNIASILTEYYNLLIRIAYFNPSEIAFPPHTTIDAAHCTRLGLSPEVIEVMQSIPFPATYELAFNKPIAQSSRAFVFTDPEDIAASRDPKTMCREIGDEPNTDFLQRSQVPLTRDMIMDCDQGGYILLLDTSTGTIRPWGEGVDWKTRGNLPLPYPRYDEEHHLNYFNWPTRPAEEVLRELVDNVKTLRQIPIVQGGRGRFVREGWREWELVRGKLMEMGWLRGAAWDREEWARASDAVMMEAWDPEDWENVKESYWEGQRIKQRELEAQRE